MVASWNYPTDAQTDFDAAASFGAWLSLRRVPQTESELSVVPLINGERTRPVKPNRHAPMPYKSRAAQRAYQREWCAKRRAHYVEKHGGKCIKCGSMRKLEFDHKDPREKISHKIWSWSIARIEAELEKCQLLCQRCHDLKTYQDFPNGFTPVLRNWQQAERRT